MGCCETKEASGEKYMESGALAGGAAEDSGSDELEQSEDDRPCWEKKGDFNADDFIFEKLSDQVVGKLPGEVGGQGFDIDSCKGCDIYIFDQIDSAQIDDCVDCRIFIGPCKGSVFLRDCTNCKLVVACQQFRTRDCHNIDVLLHCKTQPIIESSDNFRFGCFQFYYPELAGQFKQAELPMFMNDWSSIYDFTPGDSKHYKFLPVDCKVADVVPAPSVAELSGVEVDLGKSTVPNAVGERPRTVEGAGWGCLVGASPDLSMLFFAALATQGVVLVRTKEVSLKAADLHAIMGKDATVAAKASEGSVVGFWLNGPRCTAAAQAAVAAVVGAAAHVHVSGSSAAAAQESQRFAAKVELVMAV